MLPRGGDNKMFCRHFECGQEPGKEFKKPNMAGHVGEDCFGVKLSLILGIMNSTDRREETREEFLNSGKTLQEII